MLELSVLRLRLTRWGEAVKIYDKPALGYYKPHPDDFKEARQALVDIIALFDTENPAANGDFTPQNAMDNDTLLLQEALGAIAAERFRQANSLLGP